MLASAVVVACGGSAGPAPAPSASGASSQASWSAVVSAANAEGKISYWSEFTDINNQKVIQAFQKAYPAITVELTNSGAAATTGLLAKYDQALAANLPGPDVYESQNLVWVGDQKAKGLLLPIATVTGPNVAAFPKTGILVDGYSMKIIGGATALMWNTNLVKDPPKTYTDLLDPKYKGHLGIFISAATTLVLMWDQILAAAGPDYWTKLATQAPFHFYVSGAPQAQAIASGEIWVGIQASGSAAANIVATGAPVAWAYPTGAKTSGVTINAVLFAKALHPNAARVFIDWMASIDGQTTLNAANGYSQLPNIPGALPTPPQPPVEIDAKWTAAYTADRYKQFQTVIGYNP